jgi:hypothetical protein
MVWLAAALAVIGVAPGDSGLADGGVGGVGGHDN